MGQIKAGALKLPFRSEAVVVPITIDGTYHLFEERGRVSSGRVILTIHPPVATDGLSREQQRETAGIIEQRIAAPLSSPSA
jgi:1-acyl-sn-glycerol-3-phosphate acyltransferase